MTKTVGRGRRADAQRRTGVQRGKRIIVVGEVYDQFAEQFSAAMAAPIRILPTRLGLRAALSQRRPAPRRPDPDAVDKGATLRTGGQRVGDPVRSSADRPHDVTPRMRAP
jgi:acyl-CoA reductase-like NAD-dependent aldehyde dehydrogenase